MIRTIDVTVSFTIKNYRKDHDYEDLLDASMIYSTYLSLGDKLNVDTMGGTSSSQSISESGLIVKSSLRVVGVFIETKEEIRDICFNISSAFIARFEGLAYVVIDSKTLFHVWDQGDTSNEEIRTEGLPLDIENYGYRFDLEVQQTIEHVFYRDTLEKIWTNSHYTKVMKYPFEKYIIDRPKTEDEIWNEIKNQKDDKNEDEGSEFEPA